MARPFPHLDAFNPVEGLPAPSSDAEWERYNAVAFAPEHSVGLLRLCNLGCALREGIVVSGPARGAMWADDTASDGGYRPLLGPGGGRLGFAGWYRQWLDQAE